MSQVVEISVIVPAYNEAESIGPLLAEITTAMQERMPPYEIIVIDDGSTDDTAQILVKLANQYPTLRIATHSINCGQSAGQVAGFKLARGQVVVTMDADGQNDPADIPLLVEALTDGIDCVCSVRRKRHDSFVKRASSKIANGFRNLITQDKVTDAGCAYRAIRLEALAEIPVFNGLHRFVPTILRAQGYSILEVDVSHRPRALGHSKYGINNRLWRGIRDCFAMRWYRARAIKGNRLADE